MKELIKDQLYSFDEKVRVEIGPQIIELDCTDENLSNEVTHANYKIGKRDALGRFIRPDEMSEKNDKAKKEKVVVRVSIAKEKKIGVYGVINKGEKMACVDRKAKFAPLLWKIYQWQKTDDVKDYDENGDPVYIYRFIQVNGVEDKDEALTIAQTLFKEMK